MDSINAQQPEDNHEDLFGKEGIEKIIELCEKAKKMCFFCTEIGPDEFATRPMSIQKIDKSGVLWFLSAIDSKKNSQIEENSSVQLLFQGSTYSDFLTLSGTAKITTDRQTIKELWDPSVKTWFTEGVNDPRISVIIFKPKTGYYWDTKHVQMVAFAKQMIGAVIGKTLDDSIEGSITTR